MTARPAPDATANAGHALFARLLRRRLEALSDGELQLIDGERHFSFGTPAAAGLRAVVHVRSPGFYRRVALGGALGAAEAYMDGDWDCDDLTAVVRVLVRNRAVLEDLDRWWAALGKPVARVLHRLRDNTRRGSRRNIHAHYDLGNDFFALFLDPSMTYSSAVFPTRHSTLAEAATHKMDLTCRKLALQPSDHLLEVGGGWGSLAMHAAREFGCRVTTTTISRAQHDYAARAVQAAGLGERVTVLQKDYRDLEGSYDKLVSIEMVEAVGHRHRPEYFRRCTQLLKPEGLMLLQAITIADQRYGAAKGSVDFIQKYIFPGGALPSVTVMTDTVTAHTDLQVVDLHDIGQHYARTLAAWRHNFDARRREVAALGYPPEFLRMWQYYFCYCEGAFIERAISAVQILFARSGYRGGAVRL